MPEEIVRNCHSDIKLNLSAFSLSQLMYMLSFSVKFARLIDGENSSTYKTAVHWHEQCSSSLKAFEKTFNSDKPVSIEYYFRSFFE